ncbi:DEAD/DEAH box helicase [Empedobacter brevis]
MAEPIEISQLKKIIENSARFEDEFSIVKSLTYYVNSNNYHSNELVLLALNYKNKFQTTKQIINDLARQIGLFPYLNPEDLSIEDLIAYEFHRPEGLEKDNVVFHKVQAEVYYQILKGNNVILSAPTSFGKSLVIDAIVAMEKFKNIVIVVPTIALIDETRKRLSRFKEKYKIITHKSQSINEKNIFILTQERVLEIIDDSISIDFFIIDEFYKINFSNGDVDRTISLNQAFYRLYKQNSQFYLLGPNIEQINTGKFHDIRFNYIKTDFKTVINRRITVKFEDPQEKLLELLKELKKETLIFCKSPRSINDNANYIYLNGEFPIIQENQEFANWIRKEYHTEWLLADYIERGIGIHHGRLPRSLSQIILDEFNNGKIKFLFCTSTIIEGVNTKAKNIIIFDNKIADEKIDFFTYNNICGRSGRMFKHFIGNVYLFHNPPIEELPLIEFPIFTQNIDTPERLLLHMDDKDLNEESRERLKNLLNKIEFNKDYFIDNPNLEANQITSLRNKFNKKIGYYYENLKWNVPRYQELKFICELIWNDLIDNPSKKGFVASGSQLAFKLNSLKKHRSIKSILENVTSNLEDKFEINKKIETEINFLKFWPQYHFPIYLKNIENIFNKVLSENGYEPDIDYSYFGAQIESLYTDKAFNILEEYGLPFQISQKLYLNTKDRNLDDILNQVSSIDVNKYTLENIEKKILQNVQESI